MAFDRAVLGLSGGIDSALTAAIAADALGADHVLGVLMPSPYSSRGSLDDAHALAANIGIETTDAADRAADARPFDGTLRAALGADPPGVAAENIQARIRGNLLMALSNTRGALLLTTGNKSELSVGYCTLYGDMSGGLAVIADVPKTMVYRVARWRNAPTQGRPPDSRGDLTKAPSAELRPDQTDQDSLPPLRRARRHPAAALSSAISRRKRSSRPVRRRYCRRVLRLVRLAEFKRKQAAPGLKVTDRAFGTGWRVCTIAAQAHRDKRRASRSAADVSERP